MVVLAARLCGEAAAGQILVSQRVVGALDEALEVESLGELTVKGFPRPIAACNVLGLRTGAPPVAAAPGDRG